MTEIGAVLTAVLGKYGTRALKMVQIKSKCLCLNQKGRE
jgi:hypothetical protein